MKETTFRKEEMFLSPFAQKTAESKGRQREETPCPMRTDYQRDRDRIIYSKAFIRLKNKTQVFFSPEGDHYMTRLTHTLDVAQIARSISRCLDLNEDLAEAIALGHDIGHTPFGHTGERALNTLNPDGFKHNKQSLRVVDKLEKDGEGLNLTYEVRDGILEHQKNGNPHTLEGKAVSIADRIAYLNHDIEDAVRAGTFAESELPEKAVKILGNSSGKRINSMILSIYRKSYGKNEVLMEEEFTSATEELRKFMFDRVYDNFKAKDEESRAFKMISSMYGYFKNEQDKLPEFYRKFIETDGIDQSVCDYISGMTDRYAVYIFENIFVPKNFYLR